jgi:hypothetical protein
LRIPTKPIDGFSVEQASFGGGYILRMVIGATIETAVFTDHAALTSYLQFVLSGLAVNPASDPKPAPKPELVVKRARGGRPKGSKNKSKLNGSTPDLEVTANPDEAAPPITQAA